MPSIKNLKHSGSFLVLAACLAAQPACSSSEQQDATGLAAGGADMIFVGGDIVTVNDAQPSAEAVVVDDGVIVFVGSRSDAMKFRSDETAVVDLNGRTLIPGFMDGHSHFINALSVAGQANCYAAPFGPGDTKDGIIEALKRLQSEQSIPAGELIVGYGYDDSLFPDGQKLTAADLDPHFPDNPVIVQHVSLHGGVLNTRAFQKFGISAATQTPPGGVIVRKPGSDEPEGLLMETAYMDIFHNMPKPKDLAKAIQDGQLIYAAAGVTTAQEGATTFHDLELLQAAAANEQLYIDVVSYPFITEFDQVMAENSPSDFGEYKNGLKLGGIKITIDGSPQGRTALFTEPYLTGGPSGEREWRGEPTFPQPMVREFVKTVYDAGLPLIVHCNGDAAIDNFLDAHEAALGDRKSEDLRTSIIHCQFVRPDQLDKIAEFKIIPSFYTEHTYFFGETHIENRGLQQASYLSPMRDAIDRGILVANHTDFNVAPIDQLFVIWTAVNRVTRGGEVLGSDQRITPLEALKAVTINVAHWYREDDRKGSLETGKLADLVILSENPLEVDPMSIKDIRVVETFKEGRSIYRAPEHASGGS
jgi:predicted amidohydrolase YtcJ